jgi:cation diffusion facilitator family transporter
MKEINSRKAGYLEGGTAIIVNTFLFGIKIWAGVVSNSVALIADAWHSLSDSLSSVVVIAGTKLSSKGPDKEHPFGHGRWEQFAAIFIGFFLGIIAIDFIKESISNLKAGESANFGTLAIVVTVISILFNEGLAQYAFYLGRKADNLAVRADGWHHRTDALSSIVVLVGIMLKDKFWWIDGVLGILLSLLLFYAAFVIIKEVINKLMGERPTEALIRKIEDIIGEISNTDLSPHHYHIHNYGTHKELTFHIKLDGKMNIDEGHLIATSIEERIFEKADIVTTIHIEPYGYEHAFD